MKTNNQPHVAICMPTSDMVHTDFMMALLNMVSETPQVIFSFVNVRSSDIAQSRNRCVDQCLQANANNAGITHIFFIDSDIAFPSDIIKKFLKHGLNFVCACYPRRVLPYNLVGEYYSFDDHRNAVINTNERFLRNMAFAPIGCALINIDMFKELTPPYFAFETICQPKSSSEGVRRITKYLNCGLNFVYCDDPVSISEDYYFCAKLKSEAGIQIWCDVKMTQQIKHVGSYGFTVDSSNDIFKTSL